MSTADVEMIDPNDTALLNHLDQLLASSSKFIAEASENALDGTVLAIAAISRTAYSVSNASKPVVDATIEGIGTGVQAIGKEVGDIVKTLPVGEITNKEVDDLSVTTGAAVVLVAETVALGIDNGAKTIVKSTQAIVKDVVKEGSEGLLGAFVEKDRT
eukprot:g4007.t1